MQFLWTLMCILHCVVHANMKYCTNLNPEVVSFVKELCVVGPTIILWQDYKITHFVFYSFTNFWFRQWQNFDNIFQTYIHVNMYKQDTLCLQKFVSWMIFWSAGLFLIRFPCCVKLVFPKSFYILWDIFSKKDFINLAVGV